MGGTRSARESGRGVGAGVVAALAVVVLTATGCTRPSPGADTSGPARGGAASNGTPPEGRGRLAATVDPMRQITDLTPITRGLRLDKPVNGVRHGELLLTIRNNGPAPVPRLMFTVEVPESMAADGGDWAGCTPLASMKRGFPAGSKCDKGYLGVGESRSFRLGMRSPAAADGADSRVSRWLTDVWSAGEGDEFCQDAAPEDNRRIFSVYRA